MKKLLIVPALLMLAACSKGDEIVFDTRLGPATEQQVKTLPHTLGGDTDNARHSTEALKGDGMEGPGEE